MSYEQSIREENHSVLMNRTRTQAEIDQLVMEQSQLGNRAYVSWAFNLFVDDLYDSGLINAHTALQLLRPCI